MNKSDLAKKLVPVVGSHDKAVTAINVIIDEIACSLVRGERVTIMGLGSWKVIQVAARKAQNPVTGERLTIKPRKKVVFRPALALKAIIARPSLRTPQKDHPFPLTGRGQTSGRASDMVREANLMTTRKLKKK